MTTETASSPADTGPPSKSSSDGSDFVVIPPASFVQGSLLDLEQLRISLEQPSFGQEMSLEDALTMVKQLMKENLELKNAVVSNNAVMREQFRVLSVMKEQWAAEREQVRQKYTEAREVVTRLRQNVKTKDEELRTLHTQKKEESPLGEQWETVTLSSVRANDSDVTMTSQDGGPDLTNNLQVQQEEVEKLKQLISKLEADVSKYKSAQDRLTMEKRDLLALNNQLTAQLGGFKSPDSGDENKSEVVFDPSFLRIQREIEKAKKQEAAAESSAMDTSKAPDGSVTRMKEVANEGVTDVPTSPGSPARAQRKDREEKMVSDLLVQLQEERVKVTELMAKTNDHSQQMERLRHEVQDKEMELESYRAKMDSEVTRLTKEHQEAVRQLNVQLESLIRDKGQPQQPPAEQADINAMKKQLVSLVQELQQSEKKLQVAMDNVGKLKQRNQDLQTKNDLLQEDMEAQRGKDDELIQALQITITGHEVDLGKLRNERITLQSEYKIVKSNLSQLMGDYHTLYQNYEDYKGSQGTKEMRLDNLTAQILSAEETLASKDRDIAYLKEKVTLYQAQAEVYKGDFEAERKAREEAHNDKDRLKEELDNLHLRNMQLQDELHTASNNQFTEMQRRHGHLSYMQGQGQPDVVVSRRPQGPDVTGNMESHLGGQMDQFCPYTLTEECDVTEARAMDVARLLGPPISQLNQQQHHNAQGEDEVPDMICPKCQLQCPDFDTLQIHVADCLERD